MSDRLSAEAKAVGADLSVEVERESDAVPVPLIAGDAVVLHCHLLGFLYHDLFL